MESGGIPLGIYAGLASDFGHGSPLENAASTTPENETISSPLSIRELPDTQIAQLHEQPEQLSGLVKASRSDQEDFTAIEIRVARTFRAVIPILPFSHDETRLGVLTAQVFGEVLNNKFDSTGDDRYIDLAIRTLSRALESTPKQLSLIAIEIFAELARSYLNRFGQLGDVTDLNKAVECRTKVLSVQLDGLPEFPDQLRKASAKHGHRFESTGDLEPLKMAIKCAALSVQTTSDNDPKMPELLDNLGYWHHTQYEKLEDKEDLDKAIGCQIRAVSLTSSEDPDLPLWLNNLAISHISLYTHTGKVRELETAIQVFDRALALTPKDNKGLPRRLNNIGAALISRFERLGTQKDFERAIDCHTQAVSLSPEGDPELPTRLDSLGDAYRAKFKHYREPETIEQAIKYQTEAVSLLPKSHPRFPFYLSNLGASYAYQFERLGKSEDITRAIDYQTCALQLIPINHPGRPNVLNHIGTSCSRRYEQTGNLEDVDQAIKYFDEAVSLVPKGRPSLPIYYNNLGTSYHCRYDRIGQLNDLEKAIDFQIEAVLLTPDDHPHKPIWLGNLGSSFMRKFQRLGSMEDNDRAIYYLSLAITSDPKDLVILSIILNNLGTSYLCRFEHNKHVDDIDRAIEHQALAVRITPEGRLDLPVWANNLGSSYLRRFRHLGEQNDLDKALDFHYKAISLAPMGHPDLPSWYNNLGITYQTKFEHSNDPSLLMCSLDCFQKAARFITGHVEPRFSAACRWARQSAQHTGSDALAAYQIAMDLVPDLVWLGTSIGQRYGDVQQVGGVAVEAAAWAISCKEYSLALEWLEQGRSVVWNQTLQLRTPLDNLRTSYPSLTEKLEWVASELHHASTQSSIASIGPLNGSDSEIASQKQHRLAEQYKILVNQVRELPGFEDFLLPRKAHQLLTAAKKAPVAVINIHQTRCDALLLLPGRNKAAHVPLTHLTYASVQDARSLIERSLQCLGVRERGELRRPLLESDDEIHDEFVVVLATLWTDVVKPILGYLGFQHHPNIVKLPHIIWCTTGAMSFLPLHAAGFYDRPGETVSDYVVSSYTPTITALLSTEAVLSSQPNILAVSQELTPGHTHLPRTKVELSSIKECAVGSSLYTQLDNHHATTSSVLSAMQQHDWVHFACHAHQNVQDPTQSGFFLHDGVLNLATITQRAFSNKGLAFLSACQTATGDKRLADESVHLASGMIMAGYPSVIATMWSVQDSDAPMIVEKVYSRLLKDQVGSDRDVARALHDAVGM